MGQSSLGCSLAERVVVLTGGIGSGKSLAAECFAAHGITVVDADAISHRLTSSDGAAIATIQADFGPEMIMADRSLDRSKMRALVFADPAAKRRLEAILHPLIEQYAMAALRAAPGPYAIYMVPLWVEKASGGSGPDRRRIEAAAVVVVDCEEKVQVSRVTQRSQLPEAQVLAIMATQASREDRIRAATHVLNNDGSADDLRDQVDTLHRELIHS